MVTAYDVHEARIADSRAHQDIRYELNALGREFYLTNDLPLNWRSFLDDFRERLDVLEDRRLIAGGANDGLGDAISELRKDVLAPGAEPFKKTVKASLRLTEKKLKRPNAVRFSWVRLVGSAIQPGLVDAAR